MLHLALSPQEEDAKRDLESEENLLQNIRLEHIVATLEIKMPDEVNVTHDEPQIAQSPVSLNVTMNLLIGTALGFLLALLGAQRLMRLFSGEEGRTSDHPG